MYIRDSYKKRGDKRYRCLSLVETIRTPKGPRQRVVLTLGNIDVPRERWKILAEMIKRRLSGQGRLLLDEPEDLRGAVEGIVERLRRKGKIRSEEWRSEDVIRTTGEGIEVEEAREAGRAIIAEEYWKRLKMGDVLEEVGLRRKEVMMAKVEVFSRLLFPSSENGTVGWVKRTAMVDISGNEGIMEVNRDRLYRVLDKLVKKKEGIEGMSGGKVKIGMKEKGGEIYLLCKSEERAKKESGIRERFKERIEKALESLEKRVKSRKIRDIKKIEQEIGRIKQRYGRVARYYEIKTEE